MIGGRWSGARLALAGFTIAVIAVHAAIAWLSPVIGDDWGHWAWAADHAGDPALERAGAFVASHHTLSSVAGYALARSTLIHTVVTPLVGVALILGVFTFAARRLPRVDAWDDVLAIVALSAAIWIGAPRAGLIWFHRSYAASQIYGAAAVIWVLVPFRCGWRPRGAAAWLMLAGGYLAGGSTRQLGVAALIAAIVAVRRTPAAERARWMWLALVGLAGGLAAGFVEERHDFRAIKRGLEPALAALNLPIREGGELITLVLVLVFATIVLDKLRPGGGDRGAPDASETTRWFWIWIGLDAIALFGPRYSEALVFPGTLVLCIAALPYLVWVAASRLRVVVVAIAVGVHVVAWGFALASYLPVSAEYRARLAALEAAPPGGVAVVRPYRELSPGFWWFGEDWGGAAARQLVAIRVFGLRDIELAPAFRRLELNPQLAIRLEVDGVTPAQLRAAGEPALWASDISAARGQLEQLVDRLEAALGERFTARLVIDGLPLPELRGRPLIAASYERGALLALKVTRTPLDDNNRQIIRVPPSFVVTHPEAYVVAGGRSAPARYRRDGYQIQTMTNDRHVVVACDLASCIAVDVFVPVF